MHKPTILFLLFMMLTWLPASAQQTSKTFLFVGSYTDGKPGDGIHVYMFNSDNGELKEVDVVHDGINLSYLEIAPNGRFLYAASEVKQPATAYLLAYKIDTISGNLEFVNQEPVGGDDPCYVAIHRKGTHAITANYSSGSLSIFPILANGSVGTRAQLMQFEDNSINKQRQESSHLHAAVFAPKEDYICFPDLGADKIRIFRFDETQDYPLLFPDDYLEETTAGSGPRHIVFHPKGWYAYCIEELSGMISVYRSDFGGLQSIQRIFANQSQKESYWSADIHISPDGRFLYASNRGEDENNIAIFSIGAYSGELTLIGHQSTYGDHPRNFTLDPTGNFLLVANTWSNTIVVFKRDPVTGLLEKTNTEVNVPSPSCLKMRSYFNK